MGVESNLVIIIFVYLLFLPSVIYSQEKFKFQLRSKENVFITLFGSNYIYYLQSSGDFVYHPLQSAAAGCDNMTRARDMHDLSLPAAGGVKKKKR
jgi:hypothetical protein